jgi:hypothetical protein
MQQARSSNFMGSPAVEPRHEVEHQIEHRLAINARRAALSRAVVDVGVLALGISRPFDPQQHERLNSCRLRESRVPGLGTCETQSALFVHNKLPEETTMPALLIPILWVSGAVIVLGGGYYIIHVMH